MQINNKNSIINLMNDFNLSREKFVNKLESLNEEEIFMGSLHPRLNKTMRIIDLAFFVAEHDDHHIQTIKDLLVE